MEYRVHKCPNCGAKLPANFVKGTIVCEYCGNVITVEEQQKEIDNSNTGHGKYTLTMRYDASGYVVVPDMKVTIAGNTYDIENHGKIAIGLSEGDYEILFKSSIRKKRLNIRIDKDTALQIGWNRFWGTIKVNVLPGEVRYF